MEEFRVICEPPAVAQKLLNQWRHEYELMIVPIGAAVHPEGWFFTSFLVGRTRKESQDESTT